MDSQEREVFNRVLAVFEAAPRDWFTAKDVSQRAGIPQDLAEQTLRKYPGEFEQEMLLGVPVYSLARSWRLPGKAVRT